MATNAPPACWVLLDRQTERLRGVFTSLEAAKAAAERFMERNGISGCAWRDDKGLRWSYGRRDISLVVTGWTVDKILGDETPS